MNYPKFHTLVACFLLFGLSNTLYAQTAGEVEYEIGNLEMLEDGNYQLIIPSIKYNSFTLS